MSGSSNLIQFPHPAKAKVRAAVEADLPKLMKISAQAEMAAQWNPAEYKKLFAAETQGDRAALVIEQNGAVAGFIIGHQLGGHQLGGHQLGQQIGDEWDIENIAVTSAAQRGGLGSQLLTEFLKLVHERGGRAIFLEVRESNLAARALYRKWTFLETGRRKEYYENPPEDALILRFNFP
jgi:ribosomal-protein-alanine acetyltransferase